MRILGWIIAVGGALGLVVATWGLAAERPAHGIAPRFDSAFWDHWSDGKAELAGYSLIYPRYGEKRHGTAVTIFVTEPFSNSLRVKHERGGRPESDRFPVMKLNLVQDFPTGIYDYNLMTSAFVSLTDVNGRPPGTPTKISFSSQEWCGHVYAQALFDAREVRFTSHSYFDGEADAAGSLDFPVGGGAEDALLLWSRGLTGPLLDRGEHRDVRLLRSFERVRLDHTELVWDRARLSRGATPETVTVPAGTFEVERYTVAIAGAPRPRTWTFLTEVAPPHRLVQWSHDGGLEASLLGSKRLTYWSMNGPEYERALKEIGLAAD